MIGDRRRNALLQHLPEHGFLRAEGLHAAVLQDQKLIDRLDPDRPVRNHHHDGAAFARGAHRPRQRLIALGIEIGVRLVEHDQERIAVERPRQRHALRLAGRKRGALLADLGVVAVAHLDDHLVDARLLGGRDDGIGAGFGIEAAKYSGRRSLRTVRHPAADNRRGGRARRTTTGRAPRHRA